MKLYIYALFSLTFFSTIALPSSANNFQNTPGSSTAKRTSQDNSPLTPGSNTGKLKHEIEQNITPERFRISKQRLEQLDYEYKLLNQKKAANLAASKKDLKKRIAEIRALPGYEDYTGQTTTMEPFFTDVYEEERTRSGSPDIRLIGHAQSGITALPEYGYVKKYWRDTSSQPTESSAKPVKGLYFKDDILSTEPTATDMLSEQEKIDFLIKKRAEKQDPQS